MNSAIAKKLGIGSAGVLAALLFGAVFSSFLASPSGLNLVWTLAVAAVFLAVFLLQTVLVDDTWMPILFTGAQVFAISLFLLRDPSPMLLLGGAICFALLVAASYFGKLEVRNNLTIHFPKISRVIMVYATMAIALFTSFAYVGSFHINDALETKKNLEVLIGPSEPLIGRYVPNFSSRNTIREIAAAILPSEFKLATPAQKAEAVAQISTRLSESFGGFTGVPVMASDRVIDIIYKATIGKILNYSSFTQSLFMIGFGILFVFFIKFLFLFVDWAAVLIGYVLYRLLKMLNFFKIEDREISKSVIIVT